MTRSPRKVLLALASAALVTGALAGTGYAGDWGLGAGVDLARANLSGRAPEEGKYVAGGGVGVAAVLDLEVATGVQLSFQPAWVRGGANLEFKESPEFDREIVIDSVELPLMVRVYTEAVRRVRPYAIAGLAVGFPVQAEIKAQDGTEDILDEFESADARAKFGLGLRFPAGPGHVFADLVYTQGLTNLTRNDTEPETPSDQERFKSTSLALRLTWVFGV